VIIFGRGLAINYEGVYMMSTNFVESSYFAGLVSSVRYTVMQDR
jgi:hypothetical protein